MRQKMSKIHGVLFDLDGTILDTVPDLLFALNRVRAEFQLEPLPLEQIRPIANLGSKKMLKAALQVDENDARFNQLRERFIGFYEQHIADATQFFPNMERVLEYLDDEKLPWGIVTNKLTRHGTALLNALEFSHRPHCVVYGDTLKTFKPDPGPILHACDLLKLSPAQCIYVGDADTDIIASRAAGLRSLAALYGYIDKNIDPKKWLADGYINDPIEIIEWLQLKDLSTR